MFGALALHPSGATWLGPPYRDRLLAERFLVRVVRELDAERAEDRRHVDARVGVLLRALRRRDIDSALLAEVKREVEESASPEPGRGGTALPTAAASTAQSSRSQASNSSVRLNQNILFPTHVQ